MELLYLCDDFRVPCLFILHRRPGLRSVSDNKAHMPLATVSFDF